MLLSNESPAAIPPFSVAALPRILFGEGSIERLPAELVPFGRRLLLITGGQSFLAGAHWPRLVRALEERGLEWEQVGIGGEPSPDQVDAVVSRFTHSSIDMVVAIGGGSVLDAGKAIAGLLPSGRSVLDHLEGVGPQLPYEGPSLPFIAVSTTAGTGSEMTKNAVLTQAGAGGFKKSFRDERLLARLAIVDPQLLHSCPPPVMLGNAMDALTQLLEAYVSTGASAFTDALAESGIKAFAAGFSADPEQPVRDYGCIAYAAMLSGICLAQAGLGAVHGIASLLGAWFSVPHGVACGTLVAAVTRENIEALRQRAPDSPALHKYARAARLLKGGEFKGEELSGDESSDADTLVELLESWVGRCRLPRLASFGVTVSDLAQIAAASGGNSMKTNPVVLTRHEFRSILAQRL
ncbi:iron-containing alcohol dehydrogenase [Marinobacterium sp. D7]|uniref:iron-containing alcohol dehydrogenase n=1 Tax=Marinobacterium ramblicola TaxID=2849041 RepID=UPI001C2DC419|nr:iron-containing alcohol dehydrogenase [Marinobacterium ramblicola]MBV1789061.1 iron-containing alcohol dehydrogenase [Marinobacterium ramblicola]